MRIPPIAAIRRQFHAPEITNHGFEKCGAPSPTRPTAIGRPAISTHCGNLTNSMKYLNQRVRRKSKGNAANATLTSGHSTTRDALPT